MESPECVPGFPEHMYEYNELSDEGLQSEDILQHFKYDHLPPHLQVISKVFADAAASVLVLAPKRSAERSTAFRKLLEGKDCAVRAATVSM